MHDDIVEDISGDITPILVMFMARHCSSLLFLVSLSPFGLICQGMDLADDR